MNITRLPNIMLKCLMCTIVIEVLIAIILKVKNKEDVINIVLANIVTNPIVVSVPILIHIYYGSNIAKIALLILEILTIIVEGFIYHKVLKYKKINSYNLSLILNISSYIIGEIINKL